MYYRDLAKAIEEELVEQGPLVPEDRAEIEAFRVTVLAKQPALKWPRAIEKYITTYPTTDGARKISRYREWRDYQGQLRAYAHQSARYLDRIEQALLDYRLANAALVHRSTKVDEIVWQIYWDILADLPDLQKETFQKSFYKRPRAWMREVVVRWRSLIKRQKHLLELLTRAEAAMEFFNKLCILREQRRVLGLAHMEYAGKIAEVRQQVEEAILSIEEVNRHKGEVTLGSQILTLEQARNFWRRSLQEAIQAEQSGLVPGEEILERLERLHTLVQETPMNVRGVLTIEERFNNLASSNELLESLGQRLIPAEELTRARLLLHNEVPALWASGDFPRLEQTLQNLETFITYYDPRVRAGLAEAERRQPGSTKSLTPALTAAKFGLPQVTAIVRSFVNAIDARDRFMRGHSVKVSQLALKTARMLNWSTDKLETLEIAALMHDVGKLTIPEEILTKSGKLTQHEWQIIQTHPAQSAHIVQPIEGLQEIVPWVYHHQERYDGRGYPDKLAKKDIPMGANIIAVSEAFAAMTTDMPNRAALPIGEALDCISKESEKQFHPEVTEAFIQAYTP
jgi:HD-GYP domain-containing protein (c-di-GMP phosphodiesterase class II)